MAAQSLSNPPAGWVRRTEKKEDGTQVKGSSVMAEVPDVHVSEEIPQRIRLPRFFVLESRYDGWYLRLTANDGSLPTGFLKIEDSEESEDTSEQEKLELVPAKSCDRLVHIRCCYNNKYLVIADNVGTDCESGWIVAAADKPEEDKSKISCTLFLLEPVNIGGGGLEFRFLHVHLGIHACLWTCTKRAPPQFFGGLHIDSDAPDRDELNVYKLVPWEVCVNHMRRVRELEEAALCMSQQQMRRVQELEEDSRIRESSPNVTASDEETLNVTATDEEEEAALLMSQLLL